MLAYVSGCLTLPYMRQWLTQWLTQWHSGLHRPPWKRQAPGLWLTPQQCSGLAPVKCRVSGSEEGGVRVYRAHSDGYVTLEPIEGCGHGVILVQEN